VNFEAYYSIYIHYWLFYFYYFIVLLTTVGGLDGVQHIPNIESKKLFTVLTITFYYTISSFFTSVITDSSSSTSIYSINLANYFYLKLKL